MSDFDPGPGWTRGHAPEGVRAERIKYRAEDGEWKPWYREEPMQLPIWSVIKYGSAGADQPGFFHVKTPWGWALVHEDRLRFNAPGWEPRYDVEVLTVPHEKLDALQMTLDEQTEVFQSQLETIRRETAQAVIARIQEHSKNERSPYGYHLERVAREFGAEVKW